MPASENAICNPIGPVMSELDFSFLPVLCAITPFPPPDLRMFDICRRFPWLCQDVLPWPRFPDPIPFPDPPPFDPRFNDPRIFGRGFAFGGLQPAGAGGCGCGGQGGLDDATLARLAAMIAAALRKGG